MKWGVRETSERREMRKGRKRGRRRKRERKCCGPTQSEHTPVGEPRSLVCRKAHGSANDRQTHQV